MVSLTRTRKKQTLITLTYTTDSRNSFIMPNEEDSPSSFQLDFRAFNIMASDPTTPSTDSTNSPTNGESPIRPFPTSIAPNSCGCAVFGAQWKLLYTVNMAQNKQGESAKEAYTSPAGSARSSESQVRALCFVLFDLERSTVL